MMNYLTFQDYQSTPLTSSKCYKLKINNKQGKNRLNFNLEQVSNSSRRSASFRKKSSSKLFRDAKIIPTSSQKTDKSQSPKLTTPIIRSLKGKKVSFNLRDIKSSDKISIGSQKKKSFSKPAKRNMKVLSHGISISIKASKSQKNINSQKDYENSQRDFFMPKSQQNSENIQKEDIDHINLIQRIQSCQSNGIELKKKRSKTPSKPTTCHRNQLMGSLSLLIIDNCKQIQKALGNKLESVDFEESILALNENSTHILELQMEPQTIIGSQQLRDLSYLISQN